MPDVQGSPLPRQRHTSLELYLRVLDNTFSARFLLLHSFVIDLFCFNGFRLHRPKFLAASSVVYPEKAQAL
jgi:hypothetical protein